MQKNHIELKKRIDKFKRQHKKNVPNIPLATNVAFNIAVELVAGGIVGVLLGLFLDNLFDSKPLFLIICLLFASVAAFKSIWRKYIGKNGS